MAMMRIARHRSGRWLIALNPWWERGKLVFEYAWTGQTWAKGNNVFLSFDSKDEAGKHLKANRHQLEMEFLRIMPINGKARKHY